MPKLGMTNGIVVHLNCKSLNVWKNQNKLLWKLSSRSQSFPTFIMKCCSLRAYRNYPTRQWVCRIHIWLGFVANNKLLHTICHLYLNYSNSLTTCLEMDNTVLILLPDQDHLEEKESMDASGQEGSTKLSLTQKITTEICNREWWNTPLTLVLRRQRQVGQ